MITDVATLSETLSNGRIIQAVQVGNFNTLTETAEMVLRDGSTGAVISTRTFPNPHAINDFEVRDIHPLAGGRFAVLTTAETDAFVTIFASNGVAQESISVANARSGGLVLDIGVFDNPDGSATYLISGIRGNGGTFFLREAQVSGTGAVSAGPSNAIFYDGVSVTLQNGNFLTFDATSSGSQLILATRDSDFIIRDVARQDTQPIRGDTSFFIDTFVPATLADGDTAAIVWAQVGEDLEVTDDSGLFLGFVDITGAEPLDGINQAVQNIVRIDIDIEEAFDVLALPDGSLIVAWQGGIRPGLDQFVALQQGQVFWQHFASDGSALNARQAVRGTQSEVGVVLDALGEDGRFLLTTTPVTSFQSNNSITTQTFSVDLGPVLQELSNSADRFIGSARTDIVSGLGGEDFISTLGGDDTIDGGSRDDRILGGTGNDEILGSGGNDLLFGQAGDDRIFGGTGQDRMNGGSGADVFDGGSGADTVLYTQAAARVRADLSGELGGLGDAAGDSFTAVENLIGSDGNDLLFGDGAGNLLRGRDGNDQLAGSGGNDRLIGDGGGDVLTGGIGRDIMTGGADADRFLYFSATESGAGGANRDRITDFTAGEDLIALQRIDADITRGGNQAFVFIEAERFSGVAGELRELAVSNGANRLLQADLDGDRRSDFEILLNGPVDLSAMDFTL